MNKQTIAQPLNLFMSLSSAYNDFSKQIDRSLSIHGISITEFMTLHQLMLAPQQTLSRIELANSIHLTASGVTRLLNPLEKIHLVEKEKNSRDARMSLVKLSKTGAKIYKEALVTCNHVAEAHLKSITDKQALNLSALLSKIA